MLQVFSRENLQLTKLSASRVAMSSISSMARFKNPKKSTGNPTFGSSFALRKSGSLGNLTKRSTANLAPSFGSTSKSTAKAPVDLDNIEAEYIKNLQQQIYFLELESNFLRDQARKATDLQPKMTEEASRMLSKLKELQSDMDSLQLEVRRKESNLDMVNTEKERLDGKLRLLEDNHIREKKLLVEEIVTLKKQNDMIQREINDKEGQILNAKHELDKGSSSLSSAEHQIQMLQAQLDQKTEQLRSTQLALEEKRTDLIKTQSALQEMEDKYFSSTASVQDAAVADLRLEIQNLQRKLKETEMAAEHDRYMKSKMSDDVNGLVKENALFSSQVLELQKQLERERNLRESRDSRHSSNITELVSIKDKEKHLHLELNQTKEELKTERERVAQLMQALTKQEQRSTHLSLEHNTTKSKVAEMEARLSSVENENTQLRRDKMLLVDHVSELQKQVGQKEQETLRYQSHIRTLEGNLEDEKKRSHLETTMQTQKWSEFEKMAESMKNLSRSMTARSITPEY
ncbi:hypothetical protein HOLleu_40070 [Holothuria leucospilota]|uniref:Uncharacterized protein n=1 Tax=Holothuria leucospilota TaxID=206669 RepID=A0A9Q0YFA0_HOLLE|nr:hypothetical protein HOLleu_40070 [Holothuria leucospilota]